MEKKVGKENPVILFPGNSSAIYFIFTFYLLIQTGMYFKKTEIRYEYMKNQKEYCLVLEELERKNNLAISGGIQEK